MRELCVKWMRDDGATRGGAPRGDATSSWRGKREVIERRTRGGGAGRHEAVAPLLERGSTQLAELRVPLHRNNFEANWGLGMVVGSFIILS